jgi:hypothetical protein
MCARAWVWEEERVKERHKQMVVMCVVRQTESIWGSGTYIEASKSPWHVLQTRPNIVPLNPFPYSRYSKINARRKPEECYVKKKRKRCLLPNLSDIPNRLECRGVG